MTPFGQELFRIGLQHAAGTAGATVATVTPTTQMRLSDPVERIARALYDAAAILMPSWRLDQTPWAGTDERLRQHFRQIAETTVIQLDQLSKDRARARTVYRVARDSDFDNLRDEVVAERAARDAIALYDGELHQVWRERAS